ncbi:MAG: S-layer protein [Candidatus Nanohaloarchaea archaeon]|nr:S-layer protein [Candidatus Nanohaloarchaea archaeon]
MTRLVRQRDGDYYFKETLLENQPERFKALTNDTRWRILKLLAERPRYPAGIADELDMDEQKIYYHIRKLREQDLIEEHAREERRGSIAKYYRPTAYAFTLDLPHGEEQRARFPQDPEDSDLQGFLTPFVSNGSLNCTIVVGSPDPHGPHQVRGKDGHYAVDLAARLGGFGSTDGSVTSLDVEIKNEEAYGQHLILVGGPLTNVITADLNSYLPVRFEQQHFPYRKLISDQTGNEYSDEAAGLIARIRHPENSQYAVLIVAGVRHTGTKAAVMAITDHAAKVFSDYEGEENWARVVQGRDMDGDGKIDDIEILE